MLLTYFCSCRQLKMCRSICHPQCGRAAPRAAPSCGAFCSARAVPWAAGSAHRRLLPAQLPQQPPMHSRLSPSGALLGPLGIQPWLACCWPLRSCSPTLQGLDGPAASKSSLRGLSRPASQQRQTVAAFWVCCECHVSKASVCERLKYCTGLPQASSIGSVAQVLKSSLSSEYVHLL